MEIGLADSTAAELAKHPVTGTGVTLLPGGYSIKFLVRDNTTGQLGTYLGTFTIANLNRDAQSCPLRPWCSAASLSMMRRLTRIWQE